MTLLESIYHISKLLYLYTRNLLQFFDITLPCSSLNIHSSIRTPCRNHTCLARSISSNYIVPLKGINRVISSTYCLNVIMLHKSAWSELWIILYHVVTLIKDCAGILWIQSLSYAESSLELKVCPMVKRITEGIWHCFCPLLKLLPIAGILTRTETFVNTIGTHSTPLVVVTHEPYLGY